MGEQSPQPDHSRAPRREGWLRRTSPSTRWLLGVGLALLVLSAAAVIVATVERDADLDPSTPEGTVQTWLRAIANRDFATARRTFSPELRADCSDTVLRNAVGPDEFRATLLGTTESGGTVEVHAEVTVVFTDPLFGGGEYSLETYFVLRPSAGGWEFVQPPWPLYGWECGE